MADGARTLDLALHSMYECARIFMATLWPSSYDTGFCPILRSSVITVWSLRKSFLQPTRTKGTFGQKCLISGTHWAVSGAARKGEGMGDGVYEG